MAKMLGLGDRREVSVRVGVWTRTVSTLMEKGPPSGTLEGGPARCCCRGDLRRVLADAAGKDGISRKGPKTGPWERDRPYEDRAAGQRPGETSDDVGEMHRQDEEP